MFIPSLRRPLPTTPKFETTVPFTGQINLLLRYVDTVLRGALRAMAFAAGLALVLDTDVFFCADDVVFEAFFAAVFPLVYE